LDVFSYAFILKYCRGLEYCPRMIAPVQNPPWCGLTSKRSLKAELQTPVKRTAEGRQHGAGE
ncbi:MAG TPA: hypothetical protein VJX67_07865, partial [Blastocatellia bacterium]|nr:hypothetical protein [Blastocatellia bacterium]